jgi:hypothetical protein
VATHPFLVEGEQRTRCAGYVEPLHMVARLNKQLPEPGALAATLTFDEYGLAAVRRLVAEHAVLAQLPEHRAQDLQSAVNEVAANTVLHTGQPGRFRIWREEDMLVCDVTDNHLVTLYTGRDSTTTRLHMRCGGSTSSHHSAAGNMDKTPYVQRKPSNTHMGDNVKS